MASVHMKELDRYLARLDKERDAKLKKQHDRNLELIRRAWRMTNKRLKKSYEGLVPVRNLVRRLIKYYRWYNRRNKWLPHRVIILLHSLADPKKHPDAIAKLREASFELWVERRH
ncbi:MAG: hypothetical protein JRI45_06705 [Deltaproteobacteria bacterium]|nr:hypothetical protein [Deltaproteobacteria bacterium]